jgi:hypothetical protein
MIRLQSHWLLALALYLVVTPLHAQKPPTDLTGLDIEAILSLHINRDSFERWNIGYRFLNASFDGYRDGTDDLDLRTEVLGPPPQGKFPVTPTVITQQAHLLELSYRATQELSFGLQLPFIRQSSDHVSIIPNFEEFNITSSGLGDISLSTSYLAWRANNGHLLLGLGINLPTGSIDELGPTPRDPLNDTLLPFTMQLGSGTWDLAPALAYLGRHGRLRWSLGTSATLRLGENNRGYTLGDRFSLSGSIRGKASTWAEPFLRLSLQKAGRIDGVDEGLKVPLPDGTLIFPAPVTNPALFGGEEVELRLGGEFSMGRGTLKHLSINAEYGLPLYQSLNGPQPKEVGRFDLGWSWRF